MVGKHAIIGKGDVVMRLWHAVILHAIVIVAVVVSAGAAMYAYEGAEDAMAKAQKVAYTLRCPSGAEFSLAPTGITEIER